MKIGFGINFPFVRSVSSAVPPGISSVTAYDSVTTIDADETTTLTANGVAGTDAVVTWWTGTGGTGTNMGTGLTLLAAPGTYYARVTGYGAAAEASITISAATLLGTDYPFASGDHVLSLEKMNPSFTGNMIEIQRHTDDATQWFTLSGNRLSISALQSFIGSSTAGVKTMNAQYGGLVFSQATKTQQPYIAINGNLYYANGKLALYFEAARNCSLVATGYAFGGGAISAFFIKSRWGAGNLFSINRTATIDLLSAYQNSPGIARTSRYNSTSAIIGAVANNLQSVSTFIFDGTNYKSYYDKANQGSTSPASRTSFSGGNIKIGQNANGTLAGDLLFQSMVLYEYDKTSDRVAIENKLEVLYKQNFDFQTINIKVPDGWNTSTGNGFPPTGIFVNTEKTAERTDGGIVVLVGNGGVNTDADQWLPYQCSVIELLIPKPDTAADLTVATKLQEFMVYQDSNYGVNRSLQGMCRANDGTIWIMGLDVGAGGGTKVYNYTYPVNGSATLIRSWPVTANGLAYDSVNDRLIISSAATPAVVSFVNPATGAVTSAPNNFATNVDGIYCDSAKQILYGTRGTNVAACPIVSISLDATSIANKAVIVNPNIYSRANAPEGLVIGAPDGRLPILIIINNDAFNHPSTPVNYRGVNNMLFRRYE